MIKWLKTKLNSLFTKPKPLEAKIGPELKPKPKAGDKIGEVTLGYAGLKPNAYRTQQDIDNLRQSQLNKHTDFKVGDSYTVGEFVVTLHKDKASMLAAIAATDKRREEKHNKLTERGVELMLMTPEQLLELKLDEWLEKRQSNGYKIQRIMSLPMKPPPTSTTEATKQQFEELMKDVKVKDKV
jgi:hypothetical protein